MSKAGDALLFKDFEEDVDESSLTIMTEASLSDICIAEGYFEFNVVLYRHYF